MTMTRSLSATLLVVAVAAASLTDADWLVPNVTATEQQQTTSMNRQLFLGHYAVSTGLKLKEQKKRRMMTRTMMKKTSMTKSQTNTNNRRPVQPDAILPPQQLGRKGLCVLGCSPYIDLTLNNTGTLKYMALIQDMAKTCDIIVHVGDTKPPEMVCNKTNVAKSVQWLRAAAKRQNTIALYAPGTSKGAHSSVNSSRSENCSLCFVFAGA